MMMFVHRNARNATQNLIDDVQVIIVITTICVVTQLDNFSAKD